MPSSPSSTIATESSVAWAPGSYRSSPRAHPGAAANDTAPRSIHFDPIPYPGHRQQIARLSRLGFELVAKLLHVHPQVLHFLHIFVAPHLAQHFRVGDHL